MNGLTGNNPSINNQNLFNGGNTDFNRVNILPTPDKEASVEAAKTFGSVAEKGLFSPEEVVGNFEEIAETGETEQNIEDAQPVMQMPPQEQIEVASNGEAAKEDYLDTIKTDNKGINKVGLKGVQREVARLGETGDAFEFAEAIRAKAMPNNLRNSYENRRNFLMKGKAA